MLPIAAVVFAACVQTNVAILDPTTKYRPTCVAAVQIFMSPDRVPTRYTEIGVLNSSGSAGGTNERQMFESMRTKAAEVGATGVVLSRIDEPGSGAKVAAAVLGTGTQRKGRSVAIRMEGDTTKLREACSRTYTDSVGVVWTISEFQSGFARLRLENGESQTRFHYEPPRNWRDLAPREMAKLVKQSKPKK